MKHNKIALAAAVLSVSIGNQSEKKPVNWLSRLQSFTMHPKVPQIMREDVKRCLDEREIFKEYYEASKNYIGTIGTPTDESYTLEQAVTHERKAEERLEKAGAACLKLVN